MALLFRDRFDRVASSLGADWTEQPAQTVSGQSIGNCNMSCDGDYARIDTSAVFHIATANASNAATEHYVQVWCLVPNSNVFNSGLVLRFQDAANMYFLFPDFTGGTVRIHRRRAGTQTLNVATGGSVDVNNWNLLSIIHTGNRIRIWVNGNYNDSKEGPDIDFTDGTPVTGSGSCGIMSSGNTGVSGATGPGWNDFRLNTNDQRGETIYVHSSSTRNGDGEVDAPLPGISHGLNSVGCLAGTRLKIADAGPYLNSASNLETKIGHAGKFGVPGFVFPTYSDDTGEVLDEGTPNLIIEGFDHPTDRTVIRETQGTNPFFRLRAGGYGVVFRGLNFEAVATMRAVYTVASALPLDHSFSIDKCQVTCGPNGGTTPFDIQAAATIVRCTLSYIASTVNIAEDCFSFGSNAAVRASLFRMLLVKGSFNHAVNYLQTMPTWQSGDVHDCDHITFHVPNVASTVRSVVAILQPNLIAAGSRMTVQNSISFIDAPASGTGQGYGVYYGNTNTPGGTMEEHHNGFDGVALDACTAPAGNASSNHTATVCNIAAADGTKDPGFNNPSGTFTWLHTAGAGLNGEGTFAPLVVPDLRVNNLGEYKDAADDSTPLQLLDKGALQDYAVPASPSIPGSEPVEEPLDVFCPSVIYDPGGENETDLSAGTRLQEARALRQERDILLRDYRASDVDLQFADTDEVFVETNPLAFVNDVVTGEPNWFGKKVQIGLAIGSQVLVRYIGFVLALSSARGIGRLNLADRFQQLFDRPLLARSVGRIVSTTGQLGLGPALGIVTNAPATGWFLGNLTLLNQDASTRNRATICQTWTLTWTADAVPDGMTNAPFFVTGSVTGFDGEGQYGVPGSYVSKSGQIAIDTSRGGDIREDPRNIAPEDRTAARNTTTSIRTVWRPPFPSTAVEALRLLLTDWRGAGLEESEIDESIDALSGTVADQLLPSAEFLPAVTRLSFDEEDNLLSAVQQMGLHVGCTVIEKANGDIGVANFMPRVVDEPDVLCWSNDLMSLEVDHLPIYNQYTIEHAFSEINNKFTQGFASPDPEDNDSFERWQRIYPAPGSLRFRGYDASNLPWIESIARSLYLRYRNPRRIYTAKLNIDRIGADMGDVYRIDSLVPTVGPLFTEPFSIARNITGDLVTTVELVEVDSEVVTSDCGGYLALDDDLIGLDDDCWGVL